MIETVAEQPSTSSIASRMLIVEDESIVAQDLRYKLLAWGYQVAGIASSGEEAVRVAAELRPDLVLMDVRLPGRVDGIQAARAIGSRHNIPVIYLTAFSDDETLQRAKDSEPFGYITKPVRDADLRSANLANANLTATNLRTAKGLTCDQIRAAQTDGSTHLPVTLKCAK